MEWLKSWFNPEDKQTDIKLLAFVSVVIFAIVKLSSSKIDDPWVNAFYGLCALVGLGGSAWALVDKWKGGNNGGSMPQP